MILPKHETRSSDAKQARRRAGVLLVLPLFESVHGQRQLNFSTRRDHGKFHTHNRWPLQQGVGDIRRRIGGFVIVRIAIPLVFDQ